ncbi:asparaginase [Petroclostridium sp. X23]|uniref:asparaginase n=1 Tax=Petroclostridium sp. X23 TaxID=3045146 RepID=UPI0024AE30BE|nr:asparaginase [Petroclostridium sp. X23]WHH60056.1 asparaginase [Petroclostridium sp. X23]
MEPLAVVTRDDYIESVHYGYICVVDSSGKVLYNLGDYNTKIFFRSSAKPIQVIPLIQSGAAEALNFSHEEIAIACASHSGQEIHQKTVEKILTRLRLDMVNLHCGIMTPYNEEENKRLIAQGQSPSVFHCSCSGKHSAMLALAKFRGYSIDNYQELSNPVQQEILETIAAFADEDSSSIPIGTDGCGVPIYLLPIYKIALSYAKLAAHSKDTRSVYYRSCKTVFDAMTKFPKMVAGDYEFCTELMQITNGKLIGKVGCEAVYCLGVKGGNLGICIKIVDGNERAVYPVVIQLLRELDIINQSEFLKLRHWYTIHLKNNLNETIGEILPIFSIRKSANGRHPLGKKLSDFSAN